jgi:hypothetical protein
VNHSNPLAAAAVVLVIWGMANPSLSQETKPATSGTAPASAETVVVTAPRLTREQRDKVVWDFVYAHAKFSPRIDQLSRWVVPVCPKVENLPPAYAGFITNRINAIAKAVGAPVREPCQTNVEVIFTNDPQTTIDAVAEKNPNALGFHFLHDTKAVATVTRPIQAWYVTATSNRIHTYIDDPYHSPPAGTPGSRLSHGQLSVFDNILILVNAKTVAGYPIGQIADYVAMLSLSEAASPNDCGRLSSILDVMSADCPPSQKAAALTDADKLYLEGLYAMEPDEIGSLQRSAVASHVEGD